MANNYFVLNDLPRGEWSVCWPGYERDVANTPEKVLKLLEIMFEHVGVDEAMIGLQQQGRDNFNIQYISSNIWFDGRARDYISRDLARFTIPGVKFCDQYQAEKFKDHMEKRLAWKRLGGNWK